jgi:hypothetical protein
LRNENIGPAKLFDRKAEAYRREKAELNPCGKWSEADFVEFAAGVALNPRRPQKAISPFIGFGRASQNWL